MTLTLLKAKIHGARITGRDFDYEGSIVIDGVDRDVTAQQRLCKPGAQAEAFGEDLQVGTDGRA